MANNEFLPFAEDLSANVITQAAYSALPARGAGFSSGVAKSAEANKVWRQSNTIATMIGQFIADMSGLDALDNADIATLEARFKLALTNSTTRRTLITQDTTIYVSPSGNDNNTGLTPASPYLTLQRAITAVYYQYDWNNHNCIIQLANGTYTYNVINQYSAIFYGQPFGMLPFGLTLRGNSVTQSAVVLNCVGANGIAIQATKMNIDGLTVVTSGTTWAITGAQGIGISCDMGGYAVISNVTCNCSTIAYWALRSAILVLTGNNNTVTGTMGAAFYAQEAGTVYGTALAITVTGTILTPIPGGVPGAFAIAAEGAGVIWLPLITWIGTATGPRYLAFNGGTHQTGGGGPNYYPGTVAGTSTTGYYN